VYVVVFSLLVLHESFDDCIEELGDQLNAIYAFADGAPVILAGTRKDQVGEEKLQDLSDRCVTALKKRCAPAIVGLRMNGPLCFFGVENKRGYDGDASIRELVGALRGDAATWPHIFALKIPHMLCGHASLVLYESPAPPPPSPGRPPSIFG